MSEKVGKSLQRLGQIFATLSGGFFVGYGVWLSLMNNLLSTSFRLINLKHEIAKASYVNNTTRASILNKSANLPTDIAETSLEILDPAILFLIAGTISAILAIFLGIMGYWKIRDSYPKQL